MVHTLVEGFKKKSYFSVCWGGLHQNIAPASVLKDWFCNETERLHVWVLIDFFFLLCEFGLSDGEKSVTERKESRDRRKEVNAMRRLQCHFLKKNKRHDGYEKKQTVNVSSLS